jgi:hypothetical protein
MELQKISQLNLVKLQFKGVKISVQGLSVLQLQNINLMPITVFFGGLRHELSSSAQTHESWVRIPLEHGCLCAFILFVSPCTEAEALRLADPPYKESYRL